MNYFFEVALKEAYKAYNKNEIPVGAVIVKKNKIVAKAHNNRQNKCSILGHAEILCIIKAERKLKDWRLDDCDLYVTLQPCNICLDIIKEARINNVFYLKAQKFQKKPSKKIVIKQTSVCNVLRDKYNSLLKKFFLKLRNKNIT